jgi:dUTP pyrophosphatase
MKCKKLHPDAILPTRSHSTDAGLDLYANEDVTINAGHRGVVDTGIALAIPEGKVGLIWPRSGLAVKKGVDILAGVIDSTYRGPLLVCIQNTNPKNRSGFVDRLEVKKGDKIAQILIQDVCLCDIEEVGELDATERGEKGFGSSDG